jgi:hypothetical protein
VRAVEKRAGERISFPDVSFPLLKYTFLLYKNEIFTEISMRNNFTEMDRILTEGAPMKLTPSLRQTETGDQNSIEFRANFLHLISEGK